MPKRLTSEQVNTIRHLRNGGTSRPDIAKRTGLSISSIDRVLSKPPPPPMPPEERLPPLPPPSDSLRAVSVQMAADLDRLRNENRALRAALVALLG